MRLKRKKILLMICIAMVFGEMVHPFFVVFPSVYAQEASQVPYEEEMGEEEIRQEETIKAPLKITLHSLKNHAFVHKDTISLQGEITGGNPPYTLTLKGDGEGAFVVEQSHQKESPGSYHLKYNPTITGKHGFLLIVTDTSGEEKQTKGTVFVAENKAENPAIWEEELHQVSLTGHWPTDLIAIAKTQIGYKESSENFIVDSQGKKQGYTRYGDWYGAAHSPWCGMFISFSLHYANIPAKNFPREAHSGKWATKLDKLKAYEKKVEDYVPQPGDLIFINGTTKNPEHMGIVEKTVGNEVFTIQGNADNQVKEISYVFTDEKIVGYGNISKLMKKAGKILEPEKEEEAEAEAEEKTDQESSFKESEENLKTTSKEVSSNKEKAGYTKIGGLNIRKKSEKTSTRLAQIRKSGTEVVILEEETENEEWLKIRYKGITGYVLKEYIE